MGSGQRTGNYTTPIGEIEQSFANLAQTCLATQFVSYSSGINSIFLIDSDREVGYTRISKDEENAYRCDVADLTNVLSTRGPRAMLEEIPALESVMYRKEWVR